MNEAPRVTPRHPEIWAVMSFGQTTAKAAREIKQGLGFESRFMTTSLVQSGFGPLGD
jgi:hypothetical protein